MLKKLLDILVDEGINVLFSQTVPAGLSHASVDIWGEVQELRDKANSIRSSANAVGQSDYEKMTRSYGDQMLLKLAKVQDRLLDEGASFLYDTAVSEVDVFRGDAEFDGTVEEIYRRFQLKQVTTRWVRNLAINFFFGVQRQARKLVYDSNVGALKPKDAIDSELFDEDAKLHIAAFDPSNSYVRLRPFPTGEVFEEQFEYEFHTASTLPHLGELGTRGFLRDILAFESQGSSFEYVKSRSQRENKHSEKGTFTFAGGAKSRSERDCDKLERLLVDACRDRVKQHCGVERGGEHISLKLKHSSSKIGPFRIFFSLHRDTYDFFVENVGEDFKQEIEKETGVELVVPEAEPELSVSRHVREQMTMAHGFLQLLSLRFNEQQQAATDGKGALEFADLTWLTAEWMLARYRKLPCARLIDTSFRDENDWNHLIRLDRDSQLTPCKVFLKHNECIEIIKEQIHGLVNRIHN